MVRLPNLIFIALTQILFHVCVIHRILNQVGSRPYIDGWNFIALVMASVLIAGAGYIINDYFDINIDETVLRMWHGINDIKYTARAK